MTFQVRTKGHHDFINITGEVVRQVSHAKVNDAIAVVFVPSSTAAVTIIEHESGVINDLVKVLEKIASSAADYEHHQAWGDSNSAAHIKSALIGPDLTVPVEDGKLVLGAW